MTTKLVIASRGTSVSVLSGITYVSSVQQTDNRVVVSEKNLISISSLGVQGIQGPQGPKGEPGDSADTQYTLRYAETTEHIYVGEALPSSEESAEVWRVKRLSKATNIVLWADGDSDFDNVWADYLSLNYS